MNDVITIQETTVGLGDLKRVVPGGIIHVALEQRTVRLGTTGCRIHNRITADIVAVPSGAFVPGYQLVVNLVVLWIGCQTEQS